MAPDILTLSVSDAARVSGFGKTKLFQMIADGTVDSVKVGRKRLVNAKSLRRLVGATD